MLTFLSWCHGICVPTYNHRDKVEIYGKLNVTGTFEAQAPVEVWGAIVINGYM